MAPRISAMRLFHPQSRSHFRPVRSAFSFSLAAVLCLLTSVLSLPSARAYEFQNSVIWDNDSAFTSGPAWFSAGPAWLMNSLPGSHFRARPLYVLENSGDTQQSTTDAPYVGTLHDVFNVNLFSNVSGFAAGGGSSKTVNPAAALATIATFIPTSGTVSWNSNANWTGSVFPNSIDSSATFPSLTGTETVNLLQAITVGSITLTNDSTSVFTLANGTGGSLKFDVASGNASLTINGTGNVVNVLSATSTLNDTLLITINNTTTAASTGALQITGGMSGTGGVIKEGAGTVSFATNTKTYTGSTVINAGILRTSVAGEATGTSSVTVNSGGELLLAPTSSGQTFQFGSSAAVVITLNGDGATTGSGALASSSNITTLSNTISLASNSTINTASSLTLTGIISGSGGLTKSGGANLTLTNTNNYTGTTSVNSGTLFVNGSLASGSAVTVTNSGSVLGGTGTVNGSVSVASGAILEGGTGSTGQTLTLTGAVTMSSGSIIELALGPTLTHSTIAIGSPGTLSFATNQDFKFIELAGTTTGTYAGIITGVPNPGAALNSWVIDNPGWAGSFSWDGANGGEINVILTAIPEASTWIGAALALGVIGFTQRKRFGKRLRVIG